LRERFINKKRLLNPTHVCPKKEKKPDIRTIKRAVLMFKSNDDEKQETLQKRQRRQEDTTMRGNINPQ
jgi:hypothetical protein